MGLVILVVTLGKVPYVVVAVASLELDEYQVFSLFMPFTDGQVILRYWKSNFSNLILFLFKVVILDMLLNDKLGAQSFQGS